MNIFWMVGTRDFENLRFWNNVRVPFSNFPQTNGVLKMPPFARFYFFKNPQKMGFEKNPVLSGSKFPLLAIHKFISHIWEDGRRKVNNDEPDLRFFHGNFWPVMSQAVRKPCFSTSIPRGQIPRFPDAAGVGAGRILKSRRIPMAQDHFLGQL